MGPTDITVCAGLLHQCHFYDWIIKWLQKPNTSKTLKKSPKAFKKQVYLCYIFMNYVGVIIHFILIIIIIIISC